MKLKKITCIFLLFITILAYAVVVYGDDEINSLKYEDITIAYGRTFHFSLFVETVPTGVSMEELNIKSLDESIVSVDSYMDVSSGKYVIDLYANSVGRAFLYVYNNNFTEFIEICVVYPLSGSELRFDENKWKPAHICRSRNCYTYVFNLYSNVQEIENSVYGTYFAMPGEITQAFGTSAAEPVEYIYETYYENKLGFVNNVKADIRTMMGYEEGTDEWDNTFRCIDALASEPMTIYGGSIGGKCTAGKYKVVLTVNSNGYMHWYRQDSNGLWSHKMGESFVTQRDTNGDLIIDPRTCAKDFNGDVYEYVACFEVEPWYSTDDDY